MKSKIILTVSQGSLLYIKGRRQRFFGRSIQRIHEWHLKGSKKEQDGHAGMQHFFDKYKVSLEFAGSFLQGHFEGLQGVRS